MAAILGVLSAGLALSACGEASPAPADELGEGHARMLERLDEIRASIDDWNAYLGRRRLERCEAFLAEAAPGTNPKTLAQAHFEIGRERGQLGQSEAAIESLLESYRILEPIPRDQWPPFADDLVYEIGVAFLRLGEDQNCVALYNHDSCLLPLKDGAVHTETRGAREALAWLRRARAGFERGSKEELATRWVLNVAAQALGEYPDVLTEDERVPPEAFESEAEFPRFRNVAPAVGLDAFDLCGSVVTEDFDRDGDVDVLSSTWDSAGPLRYFENQGDGGFVERSREAGLAGLFGGLNLVSADYDGDGLVDVLVTRGAWMSGRHGRHPNSLLRNLGGRFQDVTFETGLAEVDGPTQTAAWADYDLDGDLDLYIGYETRPDDPIASQLLRNDDGWFTDVAESAGVTNDLFAKSVAWGDYDGDRYPDLFVSNLGHLNRLYHNRGDGTFENVAAEQGLDVPLESFTSWFWDFDNDGALDLYVSTYNQGLSNFGTRYRAGPVIAQYLGLDPLDYEGERPRLFRGDGRGSFEDVAPERGLDRVTLTMGAGVGDLDNDGFLDVYLGTGYPHYDGLTPNVMYWNRGGERFLDVTTAGGFGLSQKGHGVSFCDLDADGDQDVFEQVGGAFPGDRFGNVLFQNPGFGNHWLKVELVGVESNRAGIGGRIRAEIVDAGTRRSVYRHVATGAFGCSSFTQHLGLGRAERVERLEVFWPRTGRTQSFEDVPVDRRIVVTEGEDSYESSEEQPFVLGG